jgi:predicted transcriptional regulator
MQAVQTAAESKIHLNEPVKSLLRIKGPGVWSISPEATVYEAIEQMAKKQIGALLVLDAGKLEGIVSERDYARKVILQNAFPRNTCARNHDHTCALHRARGVD